MTMGTSFGNFVKFPRTPHIIGSEGTPDDKSLNHEESAFFFKNPNLVVEEKIDGTNMGIHFADGELILQSRGHLIRSGMHEQYDLLKSWAYSVWQELYEMLGDRYIMYGEWMYAKHTIYYTDLPHYFIEFDIYDKNNSCFLDSKFRKTILDKNIIHSVHVIHRGSVDSLDNLKNLIQNSHYGFEIAEGVYLKIEDNGKVQQRAKYVRRSFSEAVNESNQNWNQKKVIPNRLEQGKELW